MNETLEMVMVSLYKFQFPSNGKARVNFFNMRKPTSTRYPVSIPFKREGTCEPPAEKGPISTKPVDLFQFPSNGKARVNRFKVVPSVKRHSMFQFPSNGKARVNEYTCNTLIELNSVFQFPSNGKARVNQSSVVMKLSFITSFNSLQTGRHV